ncbi:hypothetical protein HanIR_Chr14g0713071 [Helianthus annuus]|nr:hypothetical protein HanIR_Chr14g0713071 [Helianthus annuus]
MPHWSVNHCHKPHWSINHCHKPLQRVSKNALGLFLSNIAPKRRGVVAWGRDSAFCSNFFYKTRPITGGLMIYNITNPFGNSPLILMR